MLKDCEKILEIAKKCGKTGSIQDTLIITSVNLNCGLSKLHDIVVSKYPEIALEVLKNSGFLSCLIPELDDVLNLVPKKHNFKPLWSHTLTVVKQSRPRKVLRWAAFFHDFGKAKTYKIVDGKVTFHNHEFISAKIFDAFSRKTKIFTRQEHRKIFYLIKNLGYVESYESSWTDSAVRRFAKEIGEDNLDDLLNLSRADITTSKKQKKDRMLARVKELRTRIIKIKKQDSAKPLLPKGIGNSIMSEFNVSGKTIGDIKAKLEQKINQKEIKAYQNIDYYMGVLKNEISEKSAAKS